MSERGNWTSASAAERDLLCPGSHLAGCGLPDLLSDEALSGTFIHAELAGKAVSPLTPEEQEVADSCRRIAEAIISEWSGGKEFERFIEERMWCAVGELQHSGQPDLVCVQGQRALIIDWKTGRNEAPLPNSNLQLRDLAVLASIRWPVTEVTVSIVQPFATRQPPCVYDDHDLAKAQIEMRHRVRMSNNPLAPRIAGERQCKYCRAKLRCPEYRAWTQQALPVVASSGLPATAWTPAQWAYFLSLAPEAEKWIKERKDTARRMLQENPASIPGYTLEDGQREKVVNPQGVFNEATAKGVTTEAFMQAVTVTKKGLKSALRTTGLKGMELDKAMDACLFGNTEVHATEPTIVKLKEEKLIA